MTRRAVLRRRDLRPDGGNVDPSGVTRAYAGAARPPAPRSSSAPGSRRSASAGPDLGPRLRRRRDHQLRALRQLPAGCGPVRSAACAASSCRSSPWSTCTSSPRPSPACGSGRVVRARRLFAMDFAGEVYMRQEGDGLLLGTYEPDGVPWSPDTTPWNFGHQLLTPDLDRIAANLPSRSTTSRSSTRSASSRVSTGPSRSPRTATRWSARSGISTATGSRAGSWPGSARAEASGWRWPTGSRKATRASTCGPWTSPVSATGPRRRTRTRRCARTTAAGSGSPTPTSSSPPPGRCLTTPIHGRLDAGERRLGRRRTGSSTRCGSSQPGRHRGTERLETATLRRSNAWDAVAGEPRRARGRRADRDDQLREVRVHRPRCTGLPRPDPDQPAARYRAHRAVPDAQRARPVDRRLHGRCTPRRLGGRGAERPMVFGSGVAEAYHQRWFDAHLPTDGGALPGAGPEPHRLRSPARRSRDLLADSRPRTSRTRRSGSCTCAVSTSA